MTYDGWKVLILKVAREYDDGDDDGIDLLARHLTEVDTAIHVIRKKGYGWQGLGLLETIKKEVPPCQNQSAPISISDVLER